MTIPGLPGGRIHAPPWKVLGVSPFTARWSFGSCAPGLPAPLVQGGCGCFPLQHGADLNGCGDLIAALGRAGDPPVDHASI